MNLKKSLIFALSLIGVTSMITQILLMRELIIIFYGNELSLGVILASWLFWISMGSWVLGRLADRIQRKIPTLVACQIFIYAVLPLILLSIRNIKNVLNVAPGEILGFLPMLYSSFAVLAPFCVISGFMFALGCRIFAAFYGESARGIGQVYILEAIGASLGGLLFNFLLIRLLNSFEIVFLAGGLNLLAAFLLLLFAEQRHLFLKAAVSVLILSALSVFIFGGAGKLHLFSSRLQWRGLNLVNTENSIYGNITVTSMADQYSFFENGLLMFTTGDLLTSEETVHFSLLEHPSPKKVLLIGGGVGGSLEQVLKHPVEEVDYIELDPLVIETAQRFLPESNLVPLRDERVKIAHMDGRLFTKTTTKKYDVVIVNLPDPFTALLNRFYSLEFFKEVKDVLTDKGILSFGVTSSENYVSYELQQFLGCLYATLKEVFSDVNMIPGDTNYFLASNAPNLLTYDYNLLMKRLKERGIQTQFVREYYLPYKLSEDRIGYIEATVERAKEIRINRDFAPVGYFYDMVLWSTYFHSRVKDVIGKFSRLNFWWLLTPIGLFFVITFPLVLKKPSLKKLPVIIAISTTGFSEILFQVVVIVSFQVLYGYVYYKLGLILTSFMIGLVFGSWTINRIMGRLKNSLRTYIKTQISICIYPLILPPIFLGLAAFGSKIPSYFGIETIFAFLPIIAGFIGGFQFPLASKICLEEDGKEVGRTAGLLYGVDLLGSCLGALLASTILIPIVGITSTLILVAILNFLILILILVPYWGAKKGLVY